MVLSKGEAYLYAYDGPMVRGMVVVVVVVYGWAAWAML
jgi:hypothetical protein